jgi:hypothetical protein
MALSAMLRPPLKKFSQQRPKDEWILFKPLALGKSWRTLFGALVSNDFQFAVSYELNQASTHAIGIAC